MKAKFAASIIAGLTFFGTTAFGYDNEVQIRDHYKEVTRQSPSTHRVCREIEVPVQRDSFSQGKAVIGGIIGGIIGHNLGGKNNRHITTGFGTLAGSVLGGSENKVSGYRSETRCQNVTEYTHRTEEVYSHSTATFWENGKKYTVKFKK